MALIERIDEVNRAFPNRKYYRFYVNGFAVGFIDTQLLIDLDQNLFTIEDTCRRVSCHFSFEEREEFERKITDFFQDYFEKYQQSGWRNEFYPVNAKYSEPALFLTERATLSYLGITGHGVHVNGYVQKTDGLYLWVAKRALTKPTAPGKLDQVVAGGLPYGISPIENVIKECEEEASIPRYIAKQARPVSALSYAYDLPIGIRPDVIFCYDLQLPDDFVPQTNDGEVDSFQLLPIEEVIETISNTRKFKFNSAIVVIDFAIRHSIITPDFPDYLALCAGMNFGKKRLCIE